MYLFLFGMMFLTVVIMAASKFSDYRTTHKVIILWHEVLMVFTAIMYGIIAVIR